MRIRGGELLMPCARDDDALARAARLAFAEPASDAIDDDVDELALREFGDYELLDVLGAGGMGVVYRARHRVLEREVALKIIAEDARNDDSGALFLDEARNAARLNHPNIVPVYDVGTRGGLHYFSMQLVDGEHLGRRIARRVL
ncbi:MAG TPA: protein kinase, partial [Xanthomonadales bacterium]|nr:protein kinase [Xanthomonadales bacterium]